MDQALSPVKRLGRDLCLGGAGLGAIGLVGWLAGVEALVTIVPGQPPMMPNTALALMLLGFAGALRHPRDASRVRDHCPRWRPSWCLPSAFGRSPNTCSTFPSRSISSSSAATKGRIRDVPHRRPRSRSLPRRRDPHLRLAYDKSIRPSEWLILCAGLHRVHVRARTTAGRRSALPVLQYTGHRRRRADSPGPPAALRRPALRTARLGYHATRNLIKSRRHNAAAPGAGVHPDCSVDRTSQDRFSSTSSAPKTSAILRAGLTVFGIAVVLPLFAITAKRLNRAHDALERSDGPIPRPRRARFRRHLRRRPRRTVYRGQRRGLSPAGITLARKSSARPSSISSCPRRKSGSSVTGSGSSRRHRSRRVDAAAEGWDLPAGGGERQDTPRRPVDSDRSRHQRAQARGEHAPPSAGAPGTCT